MKAKHFALRCLGYATMLLLVVPRLSSAAETAPLRKLRMAFTSLSGSMAVPWLAREAGIFKKHGLEVEVIATPSGVEGMNALIAGEIVFLQIAGGTLVQSLMVRPEIDDRFVRELQANGFIDALYR